MKTTIDLPADLLRTVKIRAVQENRKLKDMVAELLRRGLAAREDARSPSARHEVTLPLVRTARRAAPAGELTPQKVVDILQAQELEGTRR